MMNKFFKTLVLAAGVAAVFSVKAENDSYLYWMVSEDYSNYAAFAGKTADYAKIAYSGSESGYLLNGYTGSAEFKNFTIGQFASIGSTMLNDSYKFIAEIYGSDDQLIGYTDYITGQALKDMGATGSSVYDITGQAVFVVPEPTSGLLALLGFGLLALRRKQRA